MSSGKWQPFLSWLNVLNIQHITISITQCEILFPIVTNSTRSIAAARNSCLCWLFYSRTWPASFDCVVVGPFPEHMDQKVPVDQIFATLVYLQQINWRLHCFKYFMLNWLYIINKKCIQSHAGNGIYSDCCISIVSADGIAFCVARAPAAMLLTMWNELDYVNLFPEVGVSILCFRFFIPMPKNNMKYNNMKYKYKFVTMRLCKNAPCITVLFPFVWKIHQSPVILLTKEQ